MKTRNLYRSMSLNHSRHHQIPLPLPLSENWAEMSGSLVEIINTPRMGRRSILVDIDPKYVSQAGIWEPSEVETSRGSIRIQHLTAVSGGARPLSSSTISGSAAPSLKHHKLEECAHFHYDIVDLPALKISIRDEAPKAITGDDGDKYSFAIEVQVMGGQSWIIRRTLTNIYTLDKQLHVCCWDRSFSKLTLERVDFEEQNDDDDDYVGDLVEQYFDRLNELQIQTTCGTVLNWFEIDNKGRHLQSDDSINVPSVAAACAKKSYVAQAADELSFEAGELISVIDMPEPNEGVWWRGKRGFHVGFFPRDYVEIIGDKVPESLPVVPSTRRLQQRLSVSSNSEGTPDKPVLRKHGKLIAFFRSFILSRPSRRRLKQAGILKERVFSCDLAEHLLNTGHEIPAVLNCCAEFIEEHGIVDGIYRLSGITSNIQKLRNAFDEERIDDKEVLEKEFGGCLKQDIHAVSSLLKMYFRELPNPLCTYQLYEKFVAAAQASDESRLMRMREVVKELPPPNFRTLEYLMKHLSRVATKSNLTGMTPKNMAIVWAPNLYCCMNLEGIGVQAVVTEYLVRHADLIFNDQLPLPITTHLIGHQRSSSSCSEGRPRSLAISSPIKLVSLEEAQDKAKDDRKYIEVGGGPSSLPPKYHTVIDLPGRRSGLKNKRSPMGWRNFFSSRRSFSTKRTASKVPTPCEITVVMKNMPSGMIPQSQSSLAGRLRPVKSVENLVSSPLYIGNNCSGGPSSLGESMLEEDENENPNDMCLSKSSPATPMTDVHVIFHAPPSDQQQQQQQIGEDETSNNNMSSDPRSLQNPKTHNRSISHDSYFEFGEFRNVYIDETLEEETMSQESSKLSLDNISSSGLESSNTSPRKECGGFAGDTESINSKSLGGKSPFTPPTSVASIREVPMSDSATSAISSSSDDYFFVNELDENTKSPLLRPRLRPSKWRDSVVIEGEDSTTSVYTSNDDNTLANSQHHHHHHHNVIKLKDSAFSLQEEPESLENFTFKPLEQSNSTSVSSSKYELDKNSNDDSSTESTPPGDHFTAMTNIIYSPLVNEVSSPATTASSSCEQLANRCTPMPASNLYICPLYEAGVQNSELLSITQQVVSTTTTGLSNHRGVSSSDSCSSELPAAPLITENPVQKQQQHKNSNVPQYENVIPISKQNAETTTTTVNINNRKMMEKSTEKHIYQNERVYENELNTFDMNSATNNTSRNEQGQVIESQTAQNTNEIGKSFKDDVYSSGNSQHYENVSDSEADKANYGGSNIYEDIDDDVNSQQNGGKNSYETIRVSSNNIKKNNNNDEDDDQSDNELEATYESVQYSRNDQNEIRKHRHHHQNHDYAEILEKKPESTYKYSGATGSTSNQHLKPNSNSEDSSESHSNTEEVITYLETPGFLKIRSDSVDEQETLQESNITSPIDLTHFEDDDADEEIRHIDSPIIVDNPLYGVESATTNITIKPNNSITATNATTATTNTENTLETRNSSNNLIKGNEDEEKRNDNNVRRIEYSNNNDIHSTRSSSSASTPIEKIEEKQRCNSAPLIRKSSDAGLSLPSHLYDGECGLNDDDDDDTEDIKDISIKSDSALDEKSKSNNAEGRKMFKNNNNNSDNLKGGESFPTGRLVLCKRLSEPSLVFTNLTSSQAKIKNDAWKLADAKRLANRKQSVKELLSKFESNKEETISSSSQSQGICQLPRPDSERNNSSTLKKGNATPSLGRQGGGNTHGRFQHHRFSMGDILSQSMSSAEEDLGKSASYNMVRSDTYPELRTESCKENEGSEEIIVGSCPHSSDNGIPIVAEKVQQALRNVDMNDPSRRERIEKYKNERRTFLRQKINSELSYKAADKSPSSSERSMSSLKSPDSMSSTESVFTVIKTMPNTTTEISPPNTTSSSSTNIAARYSESPLRKRAFSDDVPPTYFNQTKTIKTDKSSVLLLSSTSQIQIPKNNQNNSQIVSKLSSSDSVSQPDDDKTEEEQEEINVKEKVALWSVRKRAFSTTTTTNTSESLSLTTTDFNFHETKDEAHPFTLKPILKEAISLPSESFTKSCPGLRREVTSSSTEISKTTKLRSTEGGKKIKDMAAFFEQKRF